MPNNILDTLTLSSVTYDLKDKNAPSVSSVTQAEYDALPSESKSGNTFFVITDAESFNPSGFVETSDFEAFSASTNTALGNKQDISGMTAYTQDTSFTAHTADTTIHVTTSDKSTWNAKQNALVSGTNIKTINNESILGSGNINIQGGSSSYSAGTNISIANNTIDCTLPISSGSSGYNSLVLGGMSDALAEGSVSYGYHSVAYATYSFAGGSESYANGYASHAEGVDVEANNHIEFSVGYNNLSSSASTSFGHSGNTLFSVGNGESTRHNAFEIRQNGDIYITSGGTDIKLQDALGQGGGGMDDDMERLISTSLVDLNDRKADKTELANYQTKGDYVTKTQLDAKANLSEVMTLAKATENEQVTASALNELNNKFGGLSLVKITESEYAALSTKDENTLYIVVADPS